jgi:H+/Cl- antiporter ClcA
MPKFLSIKAYIGKFVGITGMFIGGMSTGRTGTFAHMAVIIAN